MQGFLQALEAALKTRAGAAVALLALMLAVVLPGQATIPPIDRDEPRFAQASRQMLETGDFVDIRYLDLPRHLQPGGIYWLQAGAVAALDHDAPREIWPHRVPSWLSAIAVAFVTWWLAALFFGPIAGRVAGALMGASLLLAAEARIAKIDATLSLATLLAMAGLARHYLAVRRGEPRPHWGVALMLWAALGWGVLLKGPIIALPFVGAILALALIERRLDWLKTLRAHWGAPLALAVAAPWYVAIGFATDGDFFRTALGYSVIGKVADSHQSHGGPIGYHAALFAALFWPGSLFALLAVPLAWARRRSPEILFLFAWIAPAWLIFELTGTKLPHYTLPLFPAFAALAGAAVADGAGKPFMGRRWWTYAAALTPWLMVGLVPLAVVPAVVASQEGGLPATIYALTGLCVLGVIAVAVLVARGGAIQGAALAAGIAALAYANSFGLALPRLQSLFVSPRVVEAVTRHAPCPGATITVSSPYHEPSFAFLAAGDVILAKDGLEAARALNADPACRLALIGAASAADFTAEAARLGLAPRALETIDGRNHNERGEAVDLTLFSAGRG